MLKQFRVFGVASFAVFIASFGIIMADTFLSLFASECLSINLALIGSILGMRHLTQIFLRVPIGALSDYIGRKKMILFGLFCYSSSIGILIITQNWIHFFLGMLVYSLGMSSLFPAMFALVGDCYPKEIGAGLGKFFMMLDGGALIAPIIGGKLLSSQRLSVSYNTLFTVVLAIISVSFVVTLLFMKDSLPESRRRKYKSLLPLLRSNFQLSFTRAKNLIHNKNAFAASIAIFFMAFPMILIGTFFPLLGDERGLTKDEIGTVMGVKQFIPWMFYIPLGKISDRYGSFVSTIFSFSIISISLFMIPFSFSLLAYIILLMGVSIAFGIGFPALNKALLLEVLETDRGMALGTWGAFVAVGRTVASFVLGIIASLYGLEIIFLMSALMQLLGAVLFVRILIPLRKTMFI